MTFRQWLIVQQAMVTFERAVADGEFCWNDADDGPYPTSDEIDATMAELEACVTVLAPEGD